MNKSAQTAHIISSAFRSWEALAKCVSIVKVYTTNYWSLGSRVNVYKVIIIPMFNNLAFERLNQCLITLTFKSRVFRQAHEFNLVAHKWLDSMGEAI